MIAYQMLLYLLMQRQYVWTRKFAGRVSQTVALPYGPAGGYAPPRTHPFVSSDLRMPWAQRSDNE